jgi:quercetin dioxygenase-like cupin family protein
MLRKNRHMSISTGPKRLLYTEQYKDQPTIIEEGCMETDIRNYITRSNSIDWKPLAEDGVNTNGIYVKVLHFDDAAQRSPVFLLKFDPGSSYPYHNHPAGEEIFVLEGEVTIAGETLSTGDFLYTPSGFKHAVRSEKGCVLYLSVPEEVEILSAT